MGGGGEAGRIDPNLGNDDRGSPRTVATSVRTGGRPGLAAAGMKG